MRGFWGRAARLVAATVALMLATMALLATAAGPAGAAPSVTAGERITSFIVDLAVQADGTLKVTETIDYDFGTNSRHGLLAYVPRRVVWAPDKKYYREWRFRGLTTKADGLPAQHTEEDSGDFLTVKVGDPDVTITGKHRYVLSFLVDGAFDTYVQTAETPAHDELYWNAVGAGWTVPIDAVQVRVTGPFPVSRATCYQGPVGSTTPCGLTEAAGKQAAFTASGLADHQAVTVVVALPKGAVPHAGPLLVERRDWMYYLGLRRGSTPLFGALGLAALLAALAGVRLYRTGRDRRFAGQIPGLAPVPGQNVAAEYRPVGTSPEGPVEFVPPKGVRPGVIGALITEKAQVRDVTATVVDLAVRGYLRIEELGAAGGDEDDADWRLSRLRDADDTLRPYERDLFAALFAGRDAVTLSELKTTFAKANSSAITGVYDDLVAQGWYRVRPDRARQATGCLGVLLVLVAVGLGALLGFALHLGILAIGVAVAGLVLVFGARVAPARTPAGSAAYAQALGFRRYIRVAEAAQIRAEEREGVFSRYLPYAVAFGEAKRWVQTFAAVGAVAPAAVGWYGNPALFATSLDSFGSTASTAFTSSPASSGSSGFSGGSGGGGGGGGGGSW
jgi:uncharacterized membrane protein YgcG